MRVLLDHCVSEPFRRYLSGHEVVPARFVELDNLDDGLMLARAQEQGFEAVVTVDANIPFQQNVAGMKLAVVVIRVRQNNLNRLAPLAPEVLKVLATAEPGRVYHVRESGVT